MIATVLANYILGVLVGWLAALSVGVVGYLITLEIKEARRNRRMDAKRELLGLRRA
jgi:hypothetical protein